jgi:non-ribosomal peptide synthetase component E (peptide arylation enzyme)
MYRANTDGGVSPGAMVRVVDREGRGLPPGQEGEILSVGPKLFSGYTDTQLDAEAFTTDGWFRTGDVGHLDAEGHLTITDRKKDIVIRAGENISSREVEDLLVRHPAVLEAAVVAEPDARYGERVCAFVRLRDQQAFGIEDARALFAELGVARQKTPERILAIDDFPRSANGKVRKHELRNRLQ